MADLPIDIEKRIKRDFPKAKDYENVRALLSEIDRSYINVGKEQLIRSMLLIAKGNPDKIQEIIDTNFHHDPRDVIMMAMGISDNTSNYGIDPFEDLA
ncbi:MAG: hypothetical protein AAFR87_00620 [Bacteroidota bacterium]